MMLNTRRLLESSIDNFSNLEIGKKSRVLRSVSPVPNPEPKQYGKFTPEKIASKENSEVNFTTVTKNMNIYIDGTSSNNDPSDNSYPERKSQISSQTSQLCSKGKKEFSKTDMNLNFQKIKIEDGKDQCAKTERIALNTKGLSKKMKKLEQMG